MCLSLRSRGHVGQFPEPDRYAFRYLYDNMRAFFAASCLADFYSKRENVPLVCRRIYDNSLRMFVLCFAVRGRRPLPVRGVDGLEFTLNLHAKTFLHCAIIYWACAESYLSYARIAYFLSCLFALPLQASGAAGSESIM